MGINKSHDDYVRQVRAIGESLIKNAESIVGSERFLSSLSIYATVDLLESIPTINISKDFYPDKMFVVKDSDD